MYVLFSERSGRHYTGSCADLERRLREHNTGTCKSTRHGAPWLQVHSESFKIRAEAMERERVLKTGAERDELARILRASQLR